MKLREVILAKREPLVLSPKSALSSGSTLLNLACTDHPQCAFIKGNYYYLVGDSTSGKTWLSLTCFAESIINKHFASYDLYFDDAEGGALMNIEHYFGKGVANRMKSPAAYSDGRPRSSETIQDFYFNLRRILTRGRPFIYVLDSQDALDSASSQKKFDKQMTAAEKGNEEKGSYGDGKAKYHSENIRWVISGLRKTNSILIIIGQTRDNLGFGFDPKTRSGGKALKFYANTEIWTSVGKKIKKKVRSADRTVGVYCIAEVRKNRITGKVGKDRSVTIPIHYGYGIDDVGACIDFLVANGFWSRKKNGDRKEIKAEGLEFTGTRREIIQYVEKTGLESKLQNVTAEAWKEIEGECQLVGRKRRYE